MFNSESNILNSFNQTYKKMEKFSIEKRKHFLSDATFVGSNITKILLIPKRTETNLQQDCQKTPSCSPQHIRVHTNLLKVK